MAKQLNVDVNLNTAKAEALLRNLLSLLSLAITTGAKSSSGGLTNELVLATKAAADLKVMLNLAMNPSTGNLDLSRFSLQLAKSKTSLNDYAKSLTKLGPQGQQAFMSLSKSIVSAEVPMRESGKLLNELGTTFKNTLRWQATSSVIHNIVGGILSAMSYARGLDSSLNSIRIVTGLSADLMDRFARSANASAKALSASTLDYTDAALIYYQLGIRDQLQIKERTDATIKMANVTGTSAQKVSDLLTAIWNNFDKGGLNLEYYADVITALGAATASSSAEISAGLEKFASIAEETGLSYEYATSSLATIVATTRQSADIVGTALKTIFGRVLSLKLGETLDDGTTLGKYSQALSQVGINIKDQNGLLKDMDLILDEMGNKWQSLNRDLRVALAQSVAGARQYNLLMALMENYDFFKENVAIARGSEGELTKLAEIYAESWDAAKTRVRAAAQGIFDSLISDDFFIGFNDALATALSGIDKFIGALGGIPGTLGLIGSIVTKVFSQLIGHSIERGIQSFKVFTGVAKVEANSVRELAITAAKTFTPGDTANKSLKMESSSLQLQLVLANLYLMKMEAIAKAGGLVAASDKLRIASLMEIVELTLEAAIAALQQVEASEMAQSQASANIVRNMKAQMIKDNNGQELTKELRAEINKKANSLGIQRTNLQEDYLALSARDRLRANNYNLTTSLLMGISGLFKRQETDFQERALAAKKRAPNDAQAGAGLLRKAQLTAEARALIESGEYAEINKQYKAALRKKASLKGQDTTAIDAEIANLESKLKTMGSKIAKALKNVGNDIKMAEELALQDMSGVSESTQNKFFESVKALAESMVNADDLEDLGIAYLEETADAIESLDKESFSGLTQGLTSAMSGVANLAMGFSSLKSGIEAINDESLSFGDKLLQASMSFGMAVPMITSGLSSMVTGISQAGKGGAALFSSGLLANTAKGFGLSGGYLAALAAGTSGEFVGQKGMLGKAVKGRIDLFRFDRAVLKSLKQTPGNKAAALIAGQMVTSSAGDVMERSRRVDELAKTGKTGGAAVKGIPTGLQIAGIVAALAALAVIIAKVKKEIHEASLEGQLEKAVEQGNQLSSALDEAKNAAEGLKSAFDSYHSIADTLNKCTTGTQEWTEALRQNNNEVISLMSLYPELAKILGAILKNADGSLSISKEAEQQMNKMAQDRVDTLTWAKLANSELLQGLLDLIDLNTRSREMLEMLKAGLDIGHYAQGMAYKTDVRTSAFDTDMIGGFSYAVGGDGASLDAGERALLRQTKGAGQLTEISANQKANELLLENWGELQALSGEALTNSLGKIMSEGGLKITSDDLARYAAAVETADYRGEMTQLFNLQQALQKAFETQLIGIVANRLASEGILGSDSKTRDLVSNIFGKQLDERTKEAVARDKEAYNRGGADRKALAEAYVRAMGGDANSISWKGNEFSYLDSEGLKIEGITAAMVASVTGAASALDLLAGAATAAAGAMKEIPMTAGGDAIREFLTNEDFSKTSANDLRELLKHSVDEAGALVGPDALSKDLIKAMGGTENATKIAEALGTTLPDLIGTMTADLINQNDWLNSAERAASIKAFANRGVNRDRLEDYSRAELEARQNYEESKYSGPIKTLSELQTMAEAAGEALLYLNRTWEDGTRLSAEQAAGIKDIIQNQDLYNMAIDENTGKIKDAQLLLELLGDTVKGVGVEALRSLIPLYELLNQLYDDLTKNAKDVSSEDFIGRQESILSEIELLELEIATYQKLALVLSGALQAYDRIAKGKEYDEINDYTDELEGALNSIYSHIEKGSNGKYDWSTMQWGSHEVLAAIEALVPEDVRTGKNIAGITTEQYLRDMYGDGNVGGRYRDKDGNITKANVDNFVNDMLGKASNWGQFSGFLEGREGYTAQQLYENGFADFLGVGELGAVKLQGTIAEAAKSMHMTESSFISMLSAADKYNTSGQSYFSAFTAEGSDLATLLQFLAEAIKSSAELVVNAKKELDEAGDDPDKRAAALEKYNNALADQAKLIKAQRELQEKAMEGAAKYKALEAELSAAESEEEITSILEKMQQLKDEYGEGIEINVSIVTDESIVNNLKSLIDELFGEGGLQTYLENGGRTDYAALSKFWDNIAQLLAGADNIGLALQDTFGDAFKDIKTFEALPKTMQKAFENAGLKDAISTYLEEGLEGIETDDSILGKDSINADELIEGAKDAAELAVEAAQEVADDNPIKLTYESEEGEKGTSTSSYTGSKTNNPLNEGFTQGTTNKGGKTQSGSNPKIKVELDTTEALANLDAFIASISSIPTSIPLSISGNLYETLDSIATLSGLLHTLSGAIPVLTINTNTDEVGGKILQLKTKALLLNLIKPRITISSNASAINTSVASLKRNLDNLPDKKSITISLNVNGGGGVFPAFGTAQAFGNAFESGKWGTGKGPVPALVGELGLELVVDPANGRFYTVGDAGAEFTVLPKNAIVFNHRLTEELLRYRKINSRGQAMAEGNVSGFAAAAGVDERLQWEEKLITVIRDEVDVYKEINKQIERIEHSVLNLSRNLDRMTGLRLLDLYNKTIQLMNELYKRLRKAIEQYKEISNIDKLSLSNLLIQWEERVEDKDSKAGERKWNTNRASQFQDAFEMMMTYGGLSADAFTRGADGIVTDWDRYAVQAALAKMKLNAEITWNDRIHNEALTEVLRTQYENEYNYIILMVEAISNAVGHAEDSMDKIDGMIEDAQDTLEEMHDKQAEAIVKEFEMRQLLQENELKRIELKLARLGDSIFKRAEKLAWMFNADNIMDTSKHSQLGDWIIEAHAAMKMAEDALDAWNRSKANSLDPTGINQEKWRDITLKSFDELAELYKNMVNLRDSMMNYYSDTIKAATEELGKYTDLMDHYSSVLEHMMNLMDLTGRKFDYENKEIIIRGLINNLKNDLDLATKEYDLFAANRIAAEEHLAAHAAEYTEELYEFEYNNYVLPAIKAEQEAEEKKLKSAEDFLKKYEDLYLNAFDRINAEWEKLGSNGLGWDYLTDAMSRAKSIQEEYLTTTNKLYETNTLMRKVQQDINKTDSQVSKEKLANFNKEIEAALNTNKLNKSSMEILKARYELLQAEMALEDAKNAKSTVRLLRDSEGNYGYVYTADQDEINDKELNFADRQNELYNLVLGYLNDYQEKATQAMQEFQSKWMDLEEQRKEGIIASDAELYAKQEELKALYQEIFDAYNISMTESEYWLNQVAAEGVSEAWSKSWEERRGNLDEFIAHSDEAHNELNGYLKEIDKVRANTVQEAKLGMDNVKQKTDEVTAAHDALRSKVEDEVMPAVFSEIDAVAALTESFDELYEALDRLIGELDAYINELSYAMKVQSGGLDNDAIMDTDWSTEILHGVLNGEDTSSSETFRNMKMLDPRYANETSTSDVSSIADDMKNIGHFKDGDTADYVFGVINLQLKNGDIDWNTMSDNDKWKMMATISGQAAKNGFDTGGYTGEWGSEGKLALLHEKELVLNAADTLNILDTVNILREITKLIDLRSALTNMVANMVAPSLGVTLNGVLQQEVSIKAEFPNVTEKNEIEEAFKTLINEASLYANRY